MGQAKGSPTKQARRRLRVKNRIGNSPIGPIQDTHVIVRPMHPHFWRFIHEVEQGRRVLDGEGIDQCQALSARELDQTDLLTVGA